MDLYSMRICTRRRTATREMSTVWSTFIKGNKSAIAYIVWKRCLQLLKPRRLAAVDLAVDIERVGGVSECFVYGSNGANRVLNAFFFADAGERTKPVRRAGRVDKFVLRKHGQRFAVRHEKDVAKAVRLQS